MGKSTLLRFLAPLCLLLAAMQSGAQPVASIKTNMLYDATLTPNLGVEARVGQHSTVQLFYGLNPWNGYHGRKKLQHWSLMPEYRYWLQEKGPFSGWFTGLHLVGGEYNVAGVKLPLGLFKPLRNNHYEGWYAGGGLTLGHAWQLATHWNLEAAIGLGYVHTKYKQYENRECGDLLRCGHYNYVGPTKLALNLAYVFGSKPLPEPEPQPAAPEPLPRPVYQLTYIVPQAEAQKARDLSGRAFLDFPVNKTDIRRDYRRNAQELAKVDETISAVQADPNTTITHISIHGYASPEGSYQNNTRLAEGRARAFRDYVQQLIQLPATVFTVTSTPEDWNGLIAALDAAAAGVADAPASSARPVYGDAIRAIAADDSLAPDEKERQLKTRHPDDWSRLLQEVFPALRHSDYVVSYAVRPFTIDEAKQIIQTKPQQLSLNEMFLVAKTYAPGTPEFNEVFEVAVRLYPDDPTANLNAAITALQRSDLAAAARYLLKAGDSPEAQHTRDVLNALRQNPDAIVTAE